MNKVSIHSKGNSSFILYSCSDGRLKYYTGHRCDAPVLLKIEPLIQKLSASCHIASIPLTKELLAEKLDELFGKKKSQDNLPDQMTAVVKKMQEGKILTPEKRKYKKGTLKSKWFAIETLKRFNPKITADKFILEDFIHSCQNKGWSQNYIANQIKEIKSICALIPGTENMRKLKPTWEESFRVYLDEAEIKRIAEQECKSKNLETARDWFIIGCFTGLRVSDLTQLNKKNISKNSILISNEKTGATVMIPIHPMVKKIIDSHKGFPPYMYDQEINEYIKKVAKAAGINDTVIFTVTQGGRRKEQTFKKWEMITTHSGRRSFITNLRKNGVPDSVIMKLAGIRSFTTLKKYDLLSNEEAARIAGEHQFFK